MRFLRLLLILLSCSNLQGQSKYELSYLNGEYNAILEQSKMLSDSSDYYWNALALNKKGEPLEAISVLEFGLEKYSSNTFELLLADYYYQTGQYAKAKPFLLKYQQRNDLFLYYVKVLEFEEDYQLALDLLKVRLESDSLNLLYLKHLGVNYYRLDSIDQAIWCYKKLFTLNSSDHFAAKKLVSLYLKNKNYSEAIRVCDSILIRDSLNTSFIKLRARANFSIPNFHASIADFNTLLRLGDSSKFVLKHAGISKLNEGLFLEGRVHLIAVYGLDSTDYETCFYLGKAYLNSPYPEKGLYYLQRTIHLLQPDSKIMSAIYIEKQSIYSTLLEYQKAVECYILAYEHNPKPEYLFYIASSYENLLGNKQGAMDYYQQFLNELPEKGEISEEWEKQGQITLSMRNIAEERIVRLKEELFFEGGVSK